MLILVAFLLALRPSSLSAFNHDDEACSQVDSPYKDFGRQLAVRGITGTPFIRDCDTAPAFAPEDITCVYCSVESLSDLVTRNAGSEPDIQGQQRIWKVRGSTITLTECGIGDYGHASFVCSGENGQSMASGLRSLVSKRFYDSRISNLVKSELRSLTTVFKQDVTACYTHGADGAWYDPKHNSILCQAGFIRGLYSQGDFSGVAAVVLVLAHEFAHAMQQTFPLDDRRPYIAELEADCFAGYWVASYFAETNPAIQHRLKDELGSLLRRVGDNESRSSTLHHGTAEERERFGGIGWSYFSASSEGQGRKRVRADQNLVFRNIRLKARREAATLEIEDVELAPGQRIQSILHRCGMRLKYLRAVIEEGTRTEASLESARTVLVDLADELTSILQEGGLAAPKAADGERVLVLLRILASSFHYRPLSRGERRFAVEEIVNSAWRASHGGTSIEAGGGVIVRVLGGGDTLSDAYSLARQVVAGGALDDFSLELASWSDGQDQDAIGFAEDLLRELILLAAPKLAIVSDEWKDLASMDLANLERQLALFR